MLEQDGVADDLNMVKVLVEALFDQLQKGLFHGPAAENVPGVGAHGFDFPLGKGYSHEPRVRRLSNLFNVKP